MLNCARYWESLWYRRRLNFFTALLLPCSWIFRIIVGLRRFCYRAKWKKTHYFPVPVVVVGNITVGGTGKTPFVVWLAQLLKDHGFRPGIVSRGIGGIPQRGPYTVKIDSDPKIVGDEAIVLVRRTHCPMVVSVNRVAAVEYLLAHSDCNIVISDDGLQHYRLGRQVEIALKDSMRGLGNRYLLPAGPLREPAQRLQEVDFVVLNFAGCGNLSDNTPGSPRDDELLANLNGYTMQLLGNTLVSMQNEQQQISLDFFKNQTVHAVAGLGNPERFFAALRQKGLIIIEHIFPDHYCYQADDLKFKEAFPIVMTEKDAVKCFGFANERCWYLPVSARLDKKLIKDFLKKIV